MRKITENEIRRLERLARKTKLADMLSFFETLPERFTIPRPLLLGSNNQSEILVDGLATRWQVIDVIRQLDEPFNQTLSFQRTHLREMREKPLNTLAPIYRSMKEGFKRLCLVNHLGNCKGKIVRAHSLQKATFKNNARDGHVYEFDVWRPRDSARLWPTLVGVNDATTFTGFCEYHDRAVFSQIETTPFVRGSEQVFLHHYRAVAHAFYIAEFVGNAFRKGMSEVSKLVGGSSSGKINEQIQLMTADANELRVHKTRLDDLLAKKDWGGIEACVWQGQGVPSIFMTDFFAPRKDFGGRIVQDTKTPRLLDWVSLTITATEGNALILLCAEKGSELLRALVLSLEKLGSDEQTTRLMAYVICQFQNFIMLPCWWEALPERLQCAHVNAQNSFYFPRDLPKTCDWRLSRVA